MRPTTGSSLGGKPAYPPRAIYLAVTVALSLSKSPDSILQPRGPPHLRTQYTSGLETSMDDRNGGDNREGNAKKPRVIKDTPSRPPAAGIVMLADTLQTEAEKRRRTEQRRKRRARHADLKREQGQMLRQLGAAAPTECRFCYATTHDSSTCPDKEVIQGRDKRKLDRRLHMRQAKEEKAAASVEEVHMHENVRAVFAAQLREGSPLTSFTLAELYQQVCLRKLSKTLSEDEENDWNMKINNAVRLAIAAGDNRSSTYLGRLTL